MKLYTPEINKTRKLCSRKDLHCNARYISGSNDPLWRYGHSKLSKMAACRQLRFDETRNSAIRSADRENDKWIGSPVEEIWLLALLGNMEPPFWRKGRSYGSAMAPFERAMVVSYRYCDRCAYLYNHSVAICDRMAPTLKSTGVGQFGPKFRVFPLE